MSARLRELLAVAAAHAALWVVLASEAVAHLGDRVVGATNTETWPFLWGHEAMTRALWGEGRWFYRTDRLDWPQGGVLWLKDPLWTALLSPLTRAAGAPVSAVLEGGLLLVLAGTALYGLARQVGVGRLAAAAGAVTFAACPHFLGEAYNGNFEAMAHGWMPLWLWALVALVQAPSAGRTLAASGALFLLFLGNQYYFLAMAAVSPVVLAAELWRARAEGRTAARIGWTTAAVGLGVALCLPVAHLIDASIAAPDHLTFLDDAPQLYPPFTTDPVQLFRPFAPLVKAPPNPFQDLVYPGWVLVFAAAAAAAARRDRWSLVALGTGALFLALSLGPYLLRDGLPVEADGRFVGLPFYVLVTGKPLIGRMTLPHRLAMPAALGWSLGLALLLDVLARRGRAGLGVSLGVSALAIGEIALAPGYRLPLDTSPADRPAWAVALAESPVEGGILNLPTPANFNSRWVYLWQQAVHDRPLALSLRIGELPTVLRGGGRALRDDDPTALPVDLLDRLGRGRFAYVVLQHWLLDGPDASRAWVAELEARLGPGQAFDGVVVYPTTDAARAALAATPSCARSCLPAPALDLRPSDVWRPPAHGGVSTWEPPRSGVSAGPAPRGDARPR